MLALSDTLATLSHFVQFQGFTPIPSTRLFKHGKISLPSTGMEDFVDCLVRYPRRCTEEEKFKVQQIVRCHMNTFLMTEERYKEKSWPKYFWRQNYNLVDIQCKFC